MNVHDNSQLEIEEPLSIQVKESASTKKNSVCLWLRRIVNIDDASHQKHHFPVFIIVMCILHIFIHLVTYINVSWKHQQFGISLYELFMFFVPCMRPTPENIRIRKVNCSPPMINTTCYYDDELKQICFSFMYPHQLWRIITVNFLHMSWFHLLSNLSKQLLYGIPLERKYGSLCLIVIYWLSDLGASLTFILNNSEKSSVGASGSLYGLMLFLAVDRLIALQMNTSRRLFIFMQIGLLLVLPVTATICFIIIFKLDVAHSAHFGGGLTGFLFGIGIHGCPLSCNTEHSTFRMTCRCIAFILLFLYYVITLSIFFLKDAPIIDWILDRY